MPTGKWGGGYFHSVFIMIISNGSIIGIFFKCCKRFLIEKINLVWVRNHVLVARGKTEVVGSNSGTIF